MNRTRILIVDDEPDTEEQEAGHGRVIGIDANAMEADISSFGAAGTVNSGAGGLSLDGQCARAAEAQSATRWRSSATPVFQPSSVVIASRNAAAAAASPCTM